MTHPDKQHHKYTGAQFANRWRRIKHGAFTGHMCPSCDDPLFVDRTGGQSTARCYGCGYDTTLGVLGAIEDRDEYLQEGDQS